MTFDNGDPTAYLRALQTAEQREVNAKLDDLRARYVESGRDDKLRTLLQLLINNAAARRDPSLPYAADNRPEGIGLMITAPSGAGKSRMLREVFTDNPAFPNFGRTGQWCPLISIRAPSPCTLLQLALRILEKLDYDPDNPPDRENKAWRRVRKQLCGNGVLFLHIDDLQHVLHLLSEKEAQKVRDTLKDLMTDDEWPVQIILSGVPDLVPFAKKDKQLRRRLRYMRLDAISPGRDRKFLEKTIDSYAKKAGLKLDVPADEQLAGRLGHAAQYAFGETFAVLVESIAVAVQRGEGTLIIDDFGVAYAARNLMPDDMNPFVASAWDTIDTSLIRPKDEDVTDEDLAEAAEAVTGRRKRKSRKAR